MQLRCYTDGMSLPGTRFYQWKKRGKKFLLIMSVVFGILAAISIFSLIDFKNLADRSVSAISGGFKDFASSMAALQSQEARDSLANIKNEINNLKSHPAVALWSNLIPQLESSPELFKDLNTFAEALELVNGDLEHLKNNAFDFIVNQRGEELIKKLKELSAHIADAEQIGVNLQNTAVSLNLALGEDVLGFSADINTAKQFLDALVFWLNQPEAQNIAIIFQNPTEIRPAGGFAGSYAEVSLDHGSLSHLKVNDIYYPDKFLKSKIIPPKPLQLITPSWGARDAAWFFDFPASAGKTISLLEASDIYKERSMKLSAIIALNIYVIQSILDIIGPIDLPDYDLVVDKNNFLSEIQREVEAGDDKRAGDPKRILRVLTPIFFEKLAGLGDEQKRLLFEKLKNHSLAKDIMIFSKDPLLESYIKSVGLGGEVFNLPKQFSGDYLAVANANIGGGKSDAFIDQAVKLESKLSLDGTVNNYLTIERNHSGQGQKDWWYRSTNRNYIQILVPTSSVLNDISGNVYRQVKAPLNYGQNNYKADLDLRSIESTLKFLDDFAVEELFQFGKKTFATWFDVKAGEKKKLELQYQNANAIAVTDGAKYRFVFDKQAGVKGELELHIEAPAGYKWRESDSHLFNYSNKDVPARVILNLTLKEEK